MPFWGFVLVTGGTVAIVLVLIILTSVMAKRVVSDLGLLFWGSVLVFAAMFAFYGIIDLATTLYPEPTQ